MPLYKVGPKGVRVLRADYTYIDYPPGQVVAFASMPEMFEGELSEIKADPKHGQYENKARPAKEDKAIAAPGLLDLTREEDDARARPSRRD